MVLTIVVIVAVIFKHRKRAKQVAMSLLTFEGNAALVHLISWACIARFSTQRPFRPLLQL